MYKQVIIVRKDLNMSVGKISGQVSHAAMAFLTTDIQNNISKWLSSDGTTYYSTELTFDQDTYEQWIGDVFTKVVCGAKNKNQLLKAKTKAEELGMKEGKDFFLIYDCCKTELEPEIVDENGVGRTLTCIGFRPMEDTKINPICKKYQLL